MHEGITVAFQDLNIEMHEGFTVAFQDLNPEMHVGIIVACQDLILECMKESQLHFKISVLKRMKEPHNFAFQDLSDFSMVQNIVQA